MNQVVVAPVNFKPASCPLLTAVLPLRYAIGPIDGVDAVAFGLPALSGNFPDLGDKHPQLSQKPLGYTPRLLRDGWLYVWQSSLKKLMEYRVNQANLQQTPRGGTVIDNRSLPYLLLPAGAPAMLAWSPQQWSDAQFTVAKQAKSRQRVMREFVPGAAPLSGKAESIHEHIGDYMLPDAFKWSSEPDTRHRPAWGKLLSDMGRCEQQAYIVVDDAWGVLLDLAGLLRARQSGFDELRKARAEDWAMAGVLKSLSESDGQLRGQLPSITRYQKLRDTWKDQEAQESTYTNDIRQLSERWADWFNTLAKQGPASLDTACGHFDITQPAARAGLELHFAAACLGPSATSVGAKTLAIALTPEEQSGKPWLLWALMGLGKRLSIAEIKSLVDLADGTHGAMPQITEAGAQMTRALSLSAIINAGATSLARHSPAQVEESLFTALAPVAGLRMRDLSKQVDSLVKLYLSAALARSNQRMAVAEATPRQVGEWLSDLMGTYIAKPPARVAKLNATTAAIRQALPFLHLVPAAPPPHPQPGYGGNVPHGSGGGGRKLPSLPGGMVEEVNLKSLLKLNKEALEKAPLKCAVSLVAAVNSVWAFRTLLNDPSSKNFINFGGSVVGIGSALAAAAQKVAELDWEAVAKASGKESLSSRAALAKALGVGAKTALAQAAVSGFDVVVYGLESLEAYNAGDFDTAAINAGLSVASGANLAVYVKTYRIIRAARAAVIAGEAAVIGRGVAAVRVHWVALALGLTITIVGGVIARLYTQDTPLEKWVKGTRFGVSPADWSGSYQSAMIEFYKIVFPIGFDAYRLNELNHYKGMVETTYLILRLPGQTQLKDEMIHFKGEEVWGGLFGFGSLRKPVEWTGKDFDRHAGTRIATEQGVATYRMVYHEDKEGRALSKINGKLSYSPLEGLTLPAIEIKDFAWL